MCIAGREHMRSSLSLTSLASRTTAASILLLAACGSDPAPAPAPSASATGVESWVTHRDSAGAFEARFPATPTVQEIKPPRSSPEEMQLAVTNAQLAEETRLLVATKVVMTDVQKYDCESGLKGMVKTALAGMGCSASEETPREVQGLPGRDVSFTCQKRPMRGVMRIGCDVQKLAEHSVTAYSLMAAYQNESWNAEEAARFLDSFALLAPPAP